VVKEVKPSQNEPRHEKRDQDNKTH
jgi:hypothetical protein